MPKSKTRKEKERREAINAMQDSEIIELINEALDLQDEVKEKVGRIEEIKEILRAEAEIQEKPEFEFDGIKAIISPHTPATELSAKELYSFLRDDGRSKQFWKMVKPQIAVCNEVLGKSTVDSIGTPGDMITYHKVSFKRLQ